VGFIVYPETTGARYLCEKGEGLEFGSWVSVFKFWVLGLGDRDLGCGVCGVPGGGAIVGFER